MRLEYYFIGLAIGFVIVYIYTKKEPDIVLKEPDLDKVSENIYIDDNNVCYRYNKKEIQCPTPQSLQNDDDLI